MSDYKRLTTKKIDLEKLSEKAKLKISDTYLEYAKLNNALWELENKIENGTLIELGYHIRKSYRNHDDQRYKIILIDEVELDKIGYDGLTKAEAEKKLRELQNGTKI